MIHIRIGYECGDRLDCDMYKKCKYKPYWYKLNNAYVEIRRFFEYRLHIKLPWPIYITGKYARLSGTSKCPYNKTRHYTCHDCDYCGGPLLRECTCEERNETPYNERPQVENKWEQPCHYFKKWEFADDYKTEKF
jgi:hypothetical protein